MMSSHFEPLIPQYVTPPQKPAVVVCLILTSLHVTSPASIVDQRSAKDKSDNKNRSTDISYPVLSKNQCLSVVPGNDLNSFPDSDNSSKVTLANEKTEEKDDALDSPIEYKEKT